MRAYSVLLTVTIAFLVSSAAFAANRDEADASKLLRGANADRRRLIIGLDLGEEIPEVGALVEEAMRTNEHLKTEVAKWCADVKNKLMHKDFETKKTRYLSKELAELETLYKEYMMAKGMAQKKKIVCEEPVEKV